MDVKRLILIGGLGVVAVVGFLQLQKMGKPAPVTKAVAAPVVKEVSTVKYVDILIAKQDIPLGTRLNPELIEWQKWPAEAMHDNLIDNQNNPDALQTYLKAVTRTAIYAGEPILKPKVVHTGERGRIAALLKPGLYGTATRINVESAAGGFIQPGDRVDVILTTRVTNSSNGQTSYVSNVIFENVSVMAIGKTHNNAAGGTAFVQGSTALLQLSQEDSEVLIEAQSKGDISLILRGLDRRNAAFVPSAAKMKRRKASEVGSITVYRSGQAQHVSIQGQ